MIKMTDDDGVVMLVIDVIIMVVAEVISSAPVQNVFTALFCLSIIVFSSLHFLISKREATGLLGKLNKIIYQVLRTLTGHNRLSINASPIIIGAPGYRREIGSCMG